MHVIPRRYSLQNIYIIILHVIPRRYSKREYSTDIRPCASILRLRLIFSHILEQIYFQTFDIHYETSILELMTNHRISSDHLIEQMHFVIESF